MLEGRIQSNQEMGGGMFGGGGGFFGGGNQGYQPMQNVYQGEPVGRPGGNPPPQQHYQPFAGSGRRLDD